MSEESLGDFPLRSAISEARHKHAIDLQGNIAKEVSRK